MASNIIFILFTAQFFTIIVKCIHTNLYLGRQVDFIILYCRKERHYEAKENFAGLKSD